MSVIRKTCLLLVVSFAITACSESKRNLCNSIQKKANAEMKASETIQKGAANPQATAEYAQLLTSTADELAKLTIKDAELKNAVANYLTALRGMAAGAQKKDSSGQDTLVFSSMLRSFRQRIAEVCSKD